MSQCMNLSASERVLRRALPLPIRGPKVIGGLPSAPLRRPSAWRLRPCGSSTEVQLLPSKAVVLDVPSAAPASSAAAFSPSSGPRPEAGSESAGFVWTRHWWPLLPEAYLRPDRPNPVTLLGIPLVVWRDGSGAWRVFRDQCPHRLAPLSEGRIEADGNLSCSYHGWRFSGSGSCTRIPQAVSPQAEATACASRRSCATSYPVQLEAGMLWVWPDDSPDAPAAAAAADPVFISDALRQRAAREAAATGGSGSGTSSDSSNKGAKVLPNGALPISWMMRELPYSYEVLLENLADPSHLPFSHHGLAPTLNRALGKAMPMGPAPAPASDPPSGLPPPPAPRPSHWTRPAGPTAEFDFVGNVSPTARIALTLPYHVIYVYQMGESVVAPGQRADRTELLLAPVGPGRSRFFAPNSEFPFPVPPLAKVGLARYLFVKLISSDPVVAGHQMLNTVLDGDGVFLHVQDEVVEEKLAHLGATRSSGAGVVGLGGPGTTSAPAVAAAAAAATADATATAGSTTLEPDSTTTDGHSSTSTTSSSSSSGSSASPAVGPWSRLYYLPTPADSAVMAGRRWLDEVAGGGPFRSRQQGLLLGPRRPEGQHGVAGQAPTPEARRSLLLNRYEQHTRHCPDCRARLEWLQSLAAAARAAQTACLAAACVAAGGLGAWAKAAQVAAAAAGAAAGTAGTAAAGVAAGPGWPLALALASAVFWAVAGLVGRVAERMAQQFIFVDYIHAEKN